MTDIGDGAELRRHLDRWVSAGLIDRADAAKIEAAEAAWAGQAPSISDPAPTPPHTRRAGPRGPLVAEALGYAGGVLAMLAGFLLVRELWPDIPTAAELAFAALACVLLGGAAAALPAASSPALRRLRSVLWLMSPASLAAFMGVLGYQVWKLSPVSTALVTAAVTTACTAALWLRTRAALQHVAVFASAAALTGTAIGWLGPGLGRWGPGLGIWVLSALWWVAVMRGYLQPRAAGYFAAAAGLLAGAQLTMQVAAGHAIALATVAGLLAAGVLLRRVWLVMVGAAGVLLVVPQTATRYLPTSAAAPLAIFVAGLVLLGSATWLAKRRAHPR